MLQWLLVVFTIVQVITHYRMLIRWLTENPIDGHAFAIALQVGIPPEIDSHSANNISNIVTVGLQVPEADREVKKDTTAFQKETAVPGFAHDIDDPTAIKLEIGIKELYMVRQAAIIDDSKFKELAKQDSAFC